MYSSRITKTFLAITCLTIMFSACNSPTNHPPSNDPSRHATDRAALIRELQALHTRIASNDKKDIGKLFTFPVPDSLLSLYSADSAFDTEWQKDGVLSENVYNTRFDKISEEWQLTEFSKVFTALDITLLLHKDTLHHDAIVMTEPCYKTYSIEIDGDSVITITYGSNRNDKYKGKINAEEIYKCEFQAFWTFIFDGTRLRFVKQSAAG